MGNDDPRLQHHFRTANYIQAQSFPHFEFVRSLEDIIGEEVNNFIEREPAAH